MADQKDTTPFYDMLGGINSKASEYAVGRSQFLDIRNMDFDVPNALQKRPGSTQAVTAGTSGAVTSVFEFIKLDGTSFVVAGTETAMFYLATSTYTLLDTGWNNGQPADMLAFVNKLWIANGQNYKSWDGSTLRTVGLECPKTAPSILSNFLGGATVWKIMGMTAGVQFGVNPMAVFAYGYVRGDGYYGPVDYYLKSSATPTAIGTNNGDNLFSSAFPIQVGRFTAPPSATAIALYVGMFTGAPPLTYFNPALSTYLPGKQSNPYAVDLEGKMYLYTLLSVSATSATIVIDSWDSFQSTATPFASLSAMNFCWFDSNIPKYIEVNQNVMFGAGFSNSPSLVWFSELGAPERLDVDYNFEVRTNDGDRVLATKAYNNQLMILKENSFHKVVGDNPSNFQLVELSLQFGCLSNKTVIEFKEDLVWLDTRGIVRFNGASWDLISTPVEDVFRRLNISVAKEKAVGVHYKYRNQVWFGIPIDNSTANNLTVVWDYLIDAWTYFDGFNISSAAYVKGYLNRPTVWRGDYSGLIHYHSETFHGDNGQGITCTATPHWDKSKENETWIQRRLFLDVATVSGLTGVITGKVYSNYDTQTVAATYTMYQNSFQSRAEMGVVGKAFTTQWAHYSASLPLLINGFSWAKRFLRNV